MANQLTIGMYEGLVKSDLFGLRHGGSPILPWTRSDGDLVTIPLCAWFSREGRLGWGPLYRENTLRIIEEIHPWELFLALGMWEGVQFFEHIARQASDKSLAKMARCSGQHPGVEYIAEHCRYIFARNHRFIVEDHGWFRWFRKTMRVGGVDFRVINRKAARRIVLSGRHFY